MRLTSHHLKKIFSSSSFFKPEEKFQNLGLLINLIAVKISI